MLNCSGRNFLCYTRYRYWPKKRNTTIVWIENDKTSVLIARYGAFVLNFNQEPQHRTQQSMCNSHLFFVFNSPKAVYSFGRRHQFFEALSRKFKPLLRCLFYYTICQSQKRGFTNLSQLLIVGV
jgi:hypothetical protein